jgi:mono/diheme cytochrome c family protein
MRKLLAAGIVVVALALGGLWILSAPRTLAAADLPSHSPDLANGETMFWAGSCNSCHSRNETSGEGALLLGGGDGLATPFGTFYGPNISPDPVDGIGTWSVANFVNAMKLGVRPDGSHLYPALPYTSYQRMRVEDLIDLKAFLDTLPSVSGEAPRHQLSFPVSVRRGLGLWKRLYVDGETFQPDPSQSETFNRGAYLVRGPGHCGECHTPRNLIGGPDDSRYLAGGPAFEGEGNVPNITSHEDALGSWSERDIEFLLSDGMTPDFEVIGGSMRAVQRNMARLSQSDRAAIAHYLKSVPPIAPR